MSFIDYSICSASDAVDEIVNVMAQVYEKRDVVLENLLADFFEELREELYVFIEYPYVDRVYRDSYYSYFSSKHNEYYRDCIRVALFGKQVKAIDFRSQVSIGKLQQSFLGFIVIRPTFPNIIGRTLIDPKAFRRRNFRICKCPAEVSLNGIKLKCSGFPFSAQDGESISCAETTVWGMMEYFGNKYADYQPASPSKIIHVLNQHSKRRLIPSAGLTVDQISLALKEFGFGTMIYTAEAYGAELKNIISIYVESGIPIIAALENSTIGHAVLLIGHENDRFEHFNSTPRRSIDYNGSKRRYIDYSDLPKRFIVNDDNLTPYRSVSLDNPVEPYPTSSPFQGCTIASIVVPLYKKVYLDAVEANKLILETLADGNLGYQFASGFVFRSFLASSRSFKYHISCLPEFPDMLKECIVSSKMPKFIWCAEIYHRGNFLQNRASGLIIMDATEANDIWTDSFIFAGYPDRCIARLKNNFINLPRKFVKYTKFVSNLQ